MPICAVLPAAKVVTMCRFAGRLLCGPAIPVETVRLDENRLAPASHRLASKKILNPHIYYFGVGA